MIEMFSQYTIAVYVLLERDGKIFTLRRANTGYMDGFYYPPAGKVDEGEDCLSAAVREVKEEAGITVQAADLEFVHVGHRLADATSKMPYWVDFYFKCKKFDQDPFNAEPEKSDGIRWMDYDGHFENDKLLQDMYFSHIFAKIQQGESFSTFGWNGEQRIVTSKEAI